jgi:predicted lipoprotein with Yx(FWY)xxD motif
MRRSATWFFIVLLLPLIAACGGSSGGSPTVPAVTPPPAPELTALAAATVDATVAAGSDPPLVQVTEAAGARRILTDARGKTLYVTDQDEVDTGISSCTGGCAKTWPPLTIQFGYRFQIAGLGLFGSFVRPDEQRQLMYKGRPLYYYEGDAAPGDMKGQGKDGHWSVAVP